MKSAVAACALAFAATAAAQSLPPLTPDLFKQAGAILHVDVKTGRMAGITDKGPIAEVGAKVIDVLYGDHAANEWIAYSQRVESEYVKPAVAQRILILKREGDRTPLVDADFTPPAREALTRAFTDYRRKAELLTGEMHVPDYLLRSASNSLLHVEIKKTTPYDRGKGNLSATHVAVVVGVAQGDFKPGQTIEYIEEDNRHKRYEPLASPQRIVLVSQGRSVQDGQTKLWLHPRVDFGYTEAGFRTLQADAARVRAAQKK